MAFYELVNLSSGNRIGEFDTEEEALHDVQVVLQRRGPEGLAAIALVQDDGQGNVTMLAEGDQLAQLASGSAEASQPAVLA